MNSFIHVFNTLSGYYFYDVNKNDTVKVGKDLFEYLGNNKNDINISHELIEEINQLKRMGYLSEKRVKKIEHPMTPFVSSYLERKVGKITLQVTQNCNLRCSYCPYTSNAGGNRVHNSKRMSFDTAVKSLEMIKARSIDLDEILISFYGGEPLLEFELIKKIVKYSKENFEGKKIFFSMTTNGTLLNKDILLFLVENNFVITLSLDGPQEINDKNRKFHNSDKSVFNEVVFWIEYILRVYPDYKYKIGINMVIDPQNKLSEYNALFQNYPIFKKIRVSATIADDFYSNIKQIKTDEFIQECSYAKFLTYLSVFENLKLDTLELYEILFSEQIRKDAEGFKISDGLPDVFAPSGPCIPGDTKIFVNVSGNIFPCERVSETIKSNRIGTIVNGFDLHQTIKVLNVAMQNEEYCKNCFAFRGCSNCVKYFENAEIDASNLRKRCQTVKRNFQNELISKTYIREITQL